MTQPDKEQQVRETVFLSDPPYVDADGNGFVPQGNEYILKAKHDAEIAELQARIAGLEEICGEFEDYKAQFEEEQHQEEMRELESQEIERRILSELEDPQC